jgi:hypothetical protein
MNSFIKEIEWDQDINGAIYKSDYFRQIIIGVINHYIYESFFGIKKWRENKINTIVILMISRNKVGKYSNYQYLA